MIDGKVVALHKRLPSKRAEKIVLTLENQNIPMVANGSDIAVIVASITDKDGIVKRLVNGSVKFEIEGEGELLGEASNSGNPRKIAWGTAPILVRSSTKAGTIKIKASLLKGGINCPVPGFLEIETLSPTNQFLFDEVGANFYGNSTKIESINSSVSEKDKQIEELKKELIKLRLKEVEKQQDVFQSK